MAHRIDIYMVDMLKISLVIFALGLFFLMNGFIGEPLEVNSPAPLSNVEIMSAIDGGKIVLIQFSADWCPACREQEPIVEEFARDYSNIVTLVKIDFDTEKQAVRDYRVGSIPRTIIVDRSGNITSIFVGVTGRERLENGIKKIS